MNSLTKLALKRPVSALLIVLALAVFGINSIFGFRLELTPDMEMPMLYVLTIYQGGDPETIAKDKGLLISNDLGKVAEVIDSVLAENEKAVAQYKSGDMKVFGFIMGQCTKALKGVCTPKVIKEELEKKLKS